MAIPLYFGMTGAEMGEKRDFPGKIAWMACHFSPYGTGLSNIPQTLPEGSMMILNDRTPVCGHDPKLVAEQMAQIVDAHKCCAVLLDLQREGVSETAAIAKAVADALPCPVGVTEYYARELDCPVFLSPVPPHILPAEHLSPWQGREIWLEAALEGVEMIVTADGSSVTPLRDAATPVHAEPGLFCHYDILAESDRIRFRLFRTPEDLFSLLDAVTPYGVTRAVGLYQELGMT